MIARAIAENVSRFRPAEIGVDRSYAPSIDVFIPRAVWFEAIEKTSDTWKLPQ